MMSSLRFGCFLGLFAVACGSSSNDAGKDAPSAAGGAGGGAAGAGGAAAGNGGGSGGDTEGGAPVLEVLIQEVSLDTIPRDTLVSLKGVFVTAKKGNSDFWIQSPVGVTTPDQEYPRHAGLQVFPDPSTSELRFAVQSIKIGDCIDVTGRVSRFGGYPELDKVRALALRNLADCGVPPEPLLIDSEEAFTGILSDADPNESDPQPAVNAAAYNGLVIRVTSLTVKSTAVTGEHLMERAGASGYLAVFPPLQSGVYNIQSGQTFSAITGIYTNGIRLSPQFGLAPRTVDDLEL
jgi:hypothetical protein